MLTLSLGWSRLIWECLDIVFKLCLPLEQRQVSSSCGTDCMLIICAMIYQVQFWVMYTLQGLYTASDREVARAGKRACRLTAYNGL